MTFTGPVSFGSHVSEQTWFAAKIDGLEAKIRDVKAGGSGNVSPTGSLERYVVASATIVIPRHSNKGIATGSKGLTTRSKEATILKDFVTFCMTYHHELDERDEG